MRIVFWKFYCSVNKGVGHSAYQICWRSLATTEFADGLIDETNSFRFNSIKMNCVNAIYALYVDDDASVH